MTIEQKLGKAIEFIKSIAKLNVKDYDAFNLSDLEAAASGECRECESDDVDVRLHWPSHISLNTEYIDQQIVSDLADNAWHVLADIDALKDSK